MCKGDVFPIKVQACRRWCRKETSPNQSCARSTGSALLSRLGGRLNQDRLQVGGDLHHPCGFHHDMQDVQPGGELFYSHLNCRDISFFWATRGLCWSCYNYLVWFPTHLFQIYVSWRPRLNLPPFFFERTTITKSYGRTLWQLLQLARPLTTWSSQSSPSSSILSS